MAFERKVPDTETSSTSKMMSKFYESIICPMTRRGKEVYKYARNGALILGPVTVGLGSAGAGFQYIHVKNVATCNYEQDNAKSLNCSFSIRDYPPSVCRNTNGMHNATTQNSFTPLTCSNDINNTRQTDLILTASSWGDGIGSDWYHNRAPEIALFSAVLGLGIGVVIGGLYGFFKKLPPQSAEEERLESLLRNSYK